MSAHDPKVKLMGLGVFILPLILVKGIALLGGEPPQGAVASGSGATTVNGGVIKIFTPRWSVEQIAASQRVAELREVSFGESPLLHARMIGDTVIRPGPFIITPPNVSVRMILRSGRGNVALIDRKRFRVGDPLGEDGWFVEEIDARSVSIVHRESGKKATLVVPMPR